MSNKFWTELNDQQAENVCGGATLPNGDAKPGVTDQPYIMTVPNGKEVTTPFVIFSDNAGYPQRAIDNSPFIVS